VLLGLAIGSHIDMLRIGPLALLMLWRRKSDNGIPWRDFATLVISSIITFQVIAPWYVMHLIDNLRQIISVRILPPPPNVSVAALELWNGGIAVPLVVTVSALLLTSFRRMWSDFLCGLWLLANGLVALRLSSHGLFHDGALVVGVVALAPIGVAAVIDQFPLLRRRACALAVVVLIAGFTVYEGVLFVADRRPNQTPDSAVAWVEMHVPAGTRVYTKQRITVPLPTAEAAERLWADVAAPDAWIPKYIYDTTKKYALPKNVLYGPRPLRVIGPGRSPSVVHSRRAFASKSSPL
jgi:hypothetical protein